MGFNLSAKTTYAVMSQQSSRHENRVETASEVALMRQAAVRDPASCRIESFARQALADIHSGQAGAPTHSKATGACLGASDAGTCAFRVEVAKQVAASSCYEDLCFHQSSITARRCATHALKGLVKIVGEARRLSQRTNRMPEAIPHIHEPLRTQAQTHAGTHTDRRTHERVPGALKDILQNKFLTLSWYKTQL